MGSAWHRDSRRCWSRWSTSVEEYAERHTRQNREARSQVHSRYLYLFWVYAGMSSIVNGSNGGGKGGQHEQDDLYLTAVTRTKRSTHIMDFRSDLYHAIVAEFARQGISHPEHANVADLATHHLEMLIRRIDPVPRQVHFSDEIHDSLGSLARNTDPKCRAKASEAWGTVFYLSHLFERGKPVIPHLSREVNNTDPKKPDGLL